MRYEKETEHKIVIFMLEGKKHNYYFCIYLLLIFSLLSLLLKDSHEPSLFSNALKLAKISAATAEAC